MQIKEPLSKIDVLLSIVKFYAKSVQKCQVFKNGSEQALHENINEVHGALLGLKDQVGGLITLMPDIRFFNQLCTLVATIRQNFECFVRELPALAQHNELRSALQRVEGNSSEVDQHLISLINLVKKHVLQEEQYQMVLIIFLEKSIFFIMSELFKEAIPSLELVLTRGYRDRSTAELIQKMIDNLMVMFNFMTTANTLFDKEGQVEKLMSELTCKPIVNKAHRDWAGGDIDRFLELRTTTLKSLSVVEFVQAARAGSLRKAVVYEVDWKKARCTLAPSVIALLGSMSVLFKDMAKIEDPVKDIQNSEALIYGLAAVMGQLPEQIRQNFANYYDPQESYQIIKVVNKIMALIPSVLTQSTQMSPVVRAAKFFQLARIHGALSPETVSLYPIKPIYQNPKELLNAMGENNRNAEIVLGRLYLYFCSMGISSTDPSLWVALLTKSCGDSSQVTNNISFEQLKSRLAINLVTIVSMGAELNNALKAVANSQMKSCIDALFRAIKGSCKIQQHIAADDLVPCLIVAILQKIEQYGGFVFKLEFIVSHLVNQPYDSPLRDFFPKAVGMLNYSGETAYALTTLQAAFGNACKNQDQVRTQSTREYIAGWCDEFLLCETVRAFTSIEDKLLDTDGKLKDYLQDLTFIVAAVMIKKEQMPLISKQILEEFTSQLIRQCPLLLPLLQQATPATKMLANTLLATLVKYVNDPHLSNLHEEIIALLSPPDPAIVRQNGLG